MKKLLFIAILLSSVGCSAQEVNDSIPEWYSNPPTSSRKFYGAGEGVSEYLDIAEKKAIMYANYRLAEQVSQPKTKEIKSKTKTVSGQDNETTIQRTIVEAKLKGVTIIKKSVIQKGDKYYVYILSEMKK